MEPSAPSSAPCCNAVKTSPSDNRDRRGIEPLDHLQLEWRGQHPNLHALEFGEMTHRFARDDPRRRQREQSDAGQALIAAQAQHHVANSRIVDQARILLGRKCAGRAQGLVALVDADQKFRWTDPSLDRAELSAFDLAGNRTKLTRRIDLTLDTAAGIFLDGRRKALHPLVLGIVEGRRAQLHDVSLGVLSISRRGCCKHGSSCYCRERNTACRSESFVCHFHYLRLPGAAAFPAYLRFYDSTNFRRHVNDVRGVRSAQHILSDIYPSQADQWPSMGTRILPLSMRLTPST